MTNAADSLGEQGRRVFIDALNLAYWCGMPPSLRFPLALMRQLLANGDQAFLYFDASARHALKHEGEIYQQLLQYPRPCIEVPAGRTADGVMLRYARIGGASIVSRDRYRDYRSRFRKLIDDPTRLLPGFVADDLLQVPALELAAPVPATAELAWQQLQPLLEHPQSGGPRAVTSLA
ncbi:NYN domain-containing protein [Hydrocarboniphaga sp.]|uniref:NYN domain-containing protein n=1 Tax=Hydrocarboniphaga sp. TaxID=2033016 RepID=UPI003D0EE666